jgi:hypothetical protein
MVNAKISLATCVCLMKENIAKLILAFVFNKELSLYVCFRLGPSFTCIIGNVSCILATYKCYKGKGQQKH